MFLFLFWIIRFQILIVGVAATIRNMRNPTSIPFSKNMYISGSEISLSFTFVILSIASQVKAGALK